MQSMSVLLLEMTYSCQGKKDENLSVIPTIKKLMHWLRVMEEKDAVAARAYAVVQDILESYLLRLFEPRLTNFSHWIETILRSPRRHINLQSPSNNGGISTPLKVQCQ
jgi:hypothetical protein